jgi:hypothetical protein
VATFGSNTSEPETSPPSIRPETNSRIAFAESCVVTSMVSACRFGPDSDETAAMVVAPFLRAVP